jgi:hypothetical protein
VVLSKTPPESVTGTFGSEIHANSVSDPGGVKSAKTRRGKTEPKDRKFIIKF